MVGLVWLEFYLPGCKSLKEKRSRILPFLHRLKHDFQVSAAEMEKMDLWQQSIIACCYISNNRVVCEQQMQNIIHFAACYSDGLELIREKLEFL